MKVNLSDVFKIPNLITAVRIVLALCIIEILQSPGHAELAFWLFVIAGLTDWLDGALARCLKQGSNFGMVFDPIADKILLSGMFIALALDGKVTWLLLLIVVCRDVYISFAAIVCMKLSKIRKFPPSFWGKASTFVQIVFVAMMLMCDAFHPWLLFSSILIPLFAVFVFFFAIMSAANYTWQGVQRWREERA